MVNWSEVDTPVSVRREHTGFWPFTVENSHPWAWQDELFTADECDAIIRLATRDGLTEGRTLGDNSQTIRKSDVRFMFADGMNNWVFGKLAGAAMNLNSEYFGFDLTGFGEGLQFTRYTAPGEHYDYHVDRAPRMARRKLSVVVQLSDPADYEGGQLELVSDGHTVVMERARGRIVAFPSWTLHRVTPVTEGVRYSLVAWITGPPFR